MTKAKRINIFSTAYHKFYDIKDEKDLQKAKLTLADYDVVFNILKDLSGIDENTSETISQSVADWFQRMKFTVQPKGIGWEISI